MNSLFLMLLCAGLCFASSDSHENKLETLMDNVVVLRVPHVHGTMVEIPLTCGEAYENRPVFWKKNGLEFTPSLEGNQVKVLVKEMKGGNFTCHLGPDGEYLNHTVILVQLDPDEDNRTVILEKTPNEEGHIHCSAPNYKGSFHCTWTRTQHRSHAVVLLVKANRYMTEIPCVLEADGSGVRCQDANCPYEEEKHRISLTVYIHSHSRLEAYTKSFYMREIVRPGNLHNLHLSDAQVFSWDYPTSWDEPCTFFGLHFQVKVVHSGQSCNSEMTITEDFIEKNNYKVNVKTRKYVFCVRTQDKYTLGPWSHWSQCLVNKNGVTC